MVFFGGWRGFKEWAEGWVVGGAEREGKTKGFIKPLALKGGCGFSSLMKQRKKGENYADFCFAGKRFFIYIYDVIVKQNFYKRSTNHYSCHSEWRSLSRYIDQCNVTETVTARNSCLGGRRNSWRPSTRCCVFSLGENKTRTWSSSASSEGTEDMRHYVQDDNGYNLFANAMMRKIQDIWEMKINNRNQGSEVFDVH